jgi:hypothetical protein
MPRNANAACRTILQMPAASSTSIRKPSTTSQTRCSFRSHASVPSPAMSDDAVMTTPEPWGRKLRDQRNIGDFRMWEKLAEYQKNLERLLRDLTASGTT